MRYSDDISNLKEEPISVGTYKFDETGPYLATIKVMPCKVVKVIVAIVYFTFSRDCILKKGVLDPPSYINT
jgi:hypothetical protein